MSNLEAKVATVLGASLTDLLTSILWLLIGLLDGLCRTKGLTGSKLGKVDSLHDSSSEVSVSEHLSLVVALALPESPLVLSFLN